ncbi:hypothetical protein KL86SPO_31560 [uncultured Sporomusa sp.]|uniref:Uncharacterized protein n=1 Tax=uncultured Sporomusa sp. TaxID=307249 RepID=A0A212LV50_9FIRM|nr:hypothetical protein KL86SPO_31560 [uncultured Sporomusa sp.]
MKKVLDYTGCTSYNDEKIKYERLTRKLEANY